MLTSSAIAIVGIAVTAGAATLLFLGDHFIKMIFC